MNYYLAEHGSGTPPFGIRLLLEVGAGNKRRAQILRIFHLGADHQPVSPLGSLCPVVLFRDDRIGAVRNAVLAKISGQHVVVTTFRSPFRAPLGRDALAPTRRSNSPATKALRGCRIRRIEVEQPRLLPASVSIFRVVSLSQVMCSRPGSRITPAAPYDLHCSPQLHLSPDPMYPPPCGLRHSGEHPR